MPMHNQRCLRTCLLTLALWCTSASAADQVLMAESAVVMQALQTSFDQRNIQISQQAGTRRLELIYARPGSGASTISATVRSLPAEPARTRLTILTDSPRDTGLERQLIDAVAQQLTAPQ